jgi:hypothetical protein
MPPKSQIILAFRLPKFSFHSIWDLGFGIIWDLGFWQLVIWDLGFWHLDFEFGWQVYIYRINKRNMMIHLGNIRNYH